MCVCVCVCVCGFEISFLIIKTDNVIEILYIALSCGGYFRLRYNYR